MYTTHGLGNKIKLDLFRFLPYSKYLSSSKDTYKLNKLRVSNARKQINLRNAYGFHTVLDYVPKPGRRHPRLSAFLLPVLLLLCIQRFFVQLMHGLLEGSHWPSTSDQLLVPETNTSHLALLSESELPLKLNTIKIKF